MGLRATVTTPPAPLFSSLTCPGTGRSAENISVRKTKGALRPNCWCGELKKMKEWSRRPWQCTKPFLA
jgi:hypothetical protein